MKIKIIASLILLYSISFKAQSLSGILADSLQAPVPFIPLALIKVKDSSIVKGTNTDANGRFDFEKIKPGKYLIKIEALGFKVKFSPVYVVDTLLKMDAGLIVLNSSAVNLNEVSISTMKKAG